MIAERLRSDFADSRMRRPYAAFRLYPSFTAHIAAGIRMVKMDEFLEITPIGSDDFSAQVRRNIHKGSFGDETSRINAVMTAEERAYVDDVKDLCQNFNRHNERLSVFAVACEARPEHFSPTESEFRSRQDLLISKKIEDNCQGLVRRILSNGGWTAWSNGYGGGYKGVYWHKEGRTYFTSIANGHTYGNADLVHAGEQGIDPDTNFLEEKDRVDVGFQVFDLLPEGCNPDASIECV